MSRPSIEDEIAALPIFERLNALKLYYEVEEARGRARRVNEPNVEQRSVTQRPAPQRPAPQRPAPQRVVGTPLILGPDQQRPAPQRVVGIPLILGPDQQRPAPQRVVGTPLILGTIPKKAVNKKQDGTPLILGTIPKVSERVPATPIIRNDLILQPIAPLTRNPPPLPPKPTKRVPPPLPPKPIKQRDLTLKVIKPITLDVVREEEREPREPRTRMIDIPIINRINNKLIFDGVEAVTMEEARDVVETLNEYRRNVELNGNTLWIIVSTDMINGRHRIRRTTQYMVDDAILGLLFNHLLNNNAEEDEENNYGSDAETVLRFNILNRIEVQEILGRDNRTFGFYSKINKLEEIDLKRYQILNVKDLEKESWKEVLAPHCLVYALEQENKTTEDKMNLIANKLVGIKDKKRSFKIFEWLSGILNRQVVVTHYDESMKKRTVRYGKESEDPLYLGVIDNHCILYEMTNYSRNMIDPESQGMAKMDSLKLIKLLNEKNHMEESNILLDSGFGETRKVVLLEDLSGEQRPVIEPLKDDYSEDDYDGDDDDNDDEEKTIRGEIMIVADIECDISSKNHKPITVVYKVMDILEGDTEINEMVDTRVKAVGVNYNCIKTFFENLVKEDRKLKEAYKRKNIKGSLKYHYNIYFHNMKYDFHAMVDKLIKSGVELTEHNFVEKGGAFYKVGLSYKGIGFELRDSYKLINKSLESIGKDFKLNNRKMKGISFTYDYIRAPMFEDVEVYETFLNSEEEKRAFRENITNDEVKNECGIMGNRFMPRNYLLYYNKKDVLVLEEGLKNFREVFRNISESVDVYRYTTIASIAHAIMKVEGAYDGVYEICGALRKFIANSVLGGRNYINPDTAGMVIREIVQAEDATSLYPSAIAELCEYFGRGSDMAEYDPNLTFYMMEVKINRIESKRGVTKRDEAGLAYITKNFKEGNTITVDKYEMEEFKLKYNIEFEFIRGTYWEEREQFGLPKGEAKRIVNHAQIMEADYYTVKIRITEINKRRAVPIIINKTKNGNEFLNEVPEGGLIVTVDRYTLEDYIEYNDIRYEFIEGVYWNEGFNNKMGKIIMKWFRARQIAKAEGNIVLSEVLKLLMNSAYGKTIMKVPEGVKKIMKMDKVITIHPDNPGERCTYETIKNGKIDEYVRNNGHRIRRVERLESGYCVVVENPDIVDDYNIAHVGASILSISKRIVNRVFNACEIAGAIIYYCDTDSIHMNNKDIPEVARIYEELYGKKLQGDRLGEFHGDINITKEIDGRNIEKEAKSYESIYVAKKLYYERLRTDDGEWEKDNFRCKGVPAKALSKYCRDNNGGNMLETYLDINRNGIEVSNVSGFKYNFLVDVGTYDNGVKDINITDKTTKKLHARRRKELRELDRLTPTENEELVEKVPKNRKRYEKVEKPRETSLDNQIKWIVSDSLQSLTTEEWCQINNKVPNYPSIDDITNKIRRINALPEVSEYTDNKNYEISSEYMVKLEEYKRNRMLNIKHE